MEKIFNYQRIKRNQFIVIHVKESIQVSIFFFFSLASSYDVHGYDFCLQRQLENYQKRQNFKKKVVVCLNRYILPLWALKENFHRFLNSLQIISARGRLIDSKNFATLKENRSFYVDQNHFMNYCFHLSFHFYFLFRF